MCGLLVHPAQTHAVMFVTACVSVLGLLMLIAATYMIGRCLFRGVRWSVGRVRQS
ncbi:hypothetical protein AA0472_1849 [Acetobacter estunensis NRIC 0472]|uniref:Uncharacterized protein n=1 Tax=Acetobacter estunensis TaxID=104097 RepID=A0A967BAJ7_9PROT|nr:hypothetical protein [Acetobacter estunensis]NHO55369.1 hypothetical protein [Acetobacter estunensis]GBQ25697.1 hypothetical protein AA0472_1849 [Acetobacter estunensis NRIC 0472]